MIRRFYVHNFRCLENFELPISKRPSTLLIGRNGSGKSTVGLALEVLQRIARGVNRVGELLKPADFARGRSDVPLRLEIESILGEKVYEYILALELPPGFSELRVAEERLSVDGEHVYSRDRAQVTFFKNSTEREAKSLLTGIWWRFPSFKFDLKRMLFISSKAGSPGRSYLRRCPAGSKATPKTAP
jgi:energy-coupling factor transporter ATP-binding protein EcfA2